MLPIHFAVPCKMGLENLFGSNSRVWANIPSPTLFPSLKACTEYHWIHLGPNLSLANHRSEYPHWGIICLMDRVRLIYVIGLQPISTEPHGSRPHACHQLLQWTCWTSTSIFIGIVSWVSKTPITDVAFSVGLRMRHVVWISHRRMGCNSISASKVEQKMTMTVVLPRGAICITFLAFLNILII